MFEKFQAVFGSFRRFWSELSTIKRLALVGATLGVLVAALAYTILSSRIDYAILYTELAPEDASAIIDKLDKLKVSHQLSSGGTTIEVPREKVPELRLALAGEGLPKGGAVGFELFDKNQMGATEFEQHVNLRRALEGELARSIMTVNGVKSARVHLVLPERRLFARDEEKAAASIVLNLKRPESFGKKEVAGIVHLVSTAVPGLSRERVSVVSTGGLTLHRPNPDSDSASASEAGEIQTKQAAAIAERLESHVREQLERAVGPGNADVRVSITLDSAARERTEEHYDPTKTALRSEQKVDETSGADNPGVAGVPGAISNLPDGTAPPEEQLANKNAGGTVRRSHTRNWEVERITEKIRTPPGDVQRLSVSVLLNGTYRPDGAFVPRGEKELKNLEALVKGAVGFNELRGDEIAVKSTQFARMGDPEAAATSTPAPEWLKYWPYLLAASGVALVGLTLTVLVWRVRRKRRAARLEAIREAEEKRLEAGEAGQTVQLTGEGAHARLPEAPLEDYRAIALELASKDPATAAVVLRKWLQNATNPVLPGRA